MELKLTQEEEQLILTRRAQRKEQELEKLITIGYLKRKKPCRKVS
jgi:hypothetical protein